MHTYKVLLVAGSILFALGVFLLVLRTDHEAADLTGSPTEPLFPYIRIVEGEITAIKGGAEHMLIDGETILPPLTLKSGEGAVAHLQFPDGSEFRLDQNTELDIASSTYSIENGKLLVNATLRAGRVWSSIIGLVTPASAWEVETSNVVATVRGTAFSAAIKPDGATSLWGSENSITLDIIDPDTGNPSGKGGTMTEEEYIIIGTATATKLINGEIDFDPLPLTDEILNDPWFQNNEAADAEIRAWLETLKGEGPLNAEIRTQLFEELKKRNKSDTKESEPDQSTKEPQEETSSDALPPATPTTPQAEKETATTPAPSPLTLEIVPSVPLEKGIDEGSRVTLSALVTFSDKSHTTLTTGVTYGLAGPIGSVRGNLFVADLDPSVAEYGSYRGGLVASWTDPKTGTTLYAKTELFEVRAKNSALIEQG